MDRSSSTEYGDDIEILHEVVLSADRECNNNIATRPVNVNIVTADAPTDDSYQNDSGTVAGQYENDFTRFASCSDQGINNLIQEKDRDNTKSATKVAVGIFRQYLREKGRSENFEQYDKQMLCYILKRFYIEARTKSGELYKKSSLKSTRAGINRHLQNLGIEIDIISGPEFAEANKVYKAQGVFLKKSGKANVEHHPAIADEDLQKLFKYFKAQMEGLRPTAVGLQQMVFFNIMLHLYRRCRENIQDLKVKDFTVTKDATGAKFVMQSRDELTKNHRDEDDEAYGGRMYEMNGPMCPVAVFEMYVAALNLQCPWLFQRPLETQREGQPWFANMRLGKNTIGKMMTKLSECAGLSQKYTNHSLRSTSVTILDSCNFDARHIMAVSRHKSESSIRSYSSSVQDGKKREMSQALSKACGLQLETSGEISDDGQNQGVCETPQDESHEPAPGQLVLYTGETGELPELDDESLDSVLSTLPLNDITANFQTSSNSQVHFERYSTFMGLPGPPMHNCNVTINYNFQ